MQCAQCGMDMPDDVKACVNCGSPVARHDISDKPNEETHLLLAEANQLRMRGQFDESIGMCMRLLRVDSANAAAHSMLGDIYREQGNFQEALGWYKLAVQLNPENPADRKKLDEMIDRVFKGVVYGDPQETARALMPALPAAPPKQTAKWEEYWRTIILKAQPVHVVLGAVGMMLLLVLVVMALAQRPGRRAATKMPVPAATAATSGQQSLITSTGSGQIIPRVMPPPPDSIEIGNTRPAPDVTIEPPGTRNPTPRPAPDLNSNSKNIAPWSPSVGGGTVVDISKQTQQLKVALDRKLRESRLPSTLNSVTIDPRSGMTVLEFTIPQMNNATDTRQGLIFTAFTLVWAATEQNAALRAFTVRGQGYEDKKSTPSLAFVADVTATQAEAARAADDYPAIVRYFNNPWWRADLVNAPL